MTAAFKAIIEIVAQKRDHARVRLAEAQRLEAEGRRQLADLKGYASDAQAQWGRRALASTPIEVIVGHQSFSEGLYRAIDFQQNVVDERQRLVARCTEALRVHEQRLLSLEKVFELRVRAGDQVKRRREQKFSDEMATLSHLRNRSADMRSAP